ncbi:MAG: TylF/MycF/NovP-related O-methyltransferase, partial [Dehalococcoidia bacterium]
LLERQNFSPNFVSDRVRLVPGWLEDTLPKISTNIALLHIDVDLHDSYLTVLNNLYDQVVSGGVIAFDEYKSPWDLDRFPGASVAIDSFFSGLPGEIERDPHVMKWFYVKP